MNINRNFIIFAVISGLAVGTILVYANSVKPTSNSSTPQNITSVGEESSSPQSVLGASSDASNQTQQAQTQLQGQTQSQQQQQQQQIQSSSTQQAPSQQQSPQNPNTLPPAPTGPITQLEMKDEVVGAGDKVVSGDTAEVNYIGTFLDGTKFDSSYDRNQTFSFQVGAGQVIKGWDEGLVGMQAGGKRLLIIPSDLAYGETGSEGAIPPNTPLMFEVELVSIKHAQ